MKDFNFYYYSIIDLSKDLYTGKEHQYTIDFFEEIQEDLYSCYHKEGNDFLGTLVGSLHYKTENLLEICDKTLYDYQILTKLLKILQA